MPNVLVRADIGGEYGMGHAVRMRALARELIAHGASVMFVTTTSSLKDYVSPLPCQMLTDGIRFNAGDVLVIDTKDPAAVQERDLLSLRQRGVRVVRIDHPFATRKSCDLLVGPCAHWSPETLTHLQSVFGNRFLYGWDYVMLSEKVGKKEPIPYAQRDKSIVFCAGGSDPSGALEQMWEWTTRLTGDARAYFVYGAKHQGRIGKEYPWTDGRVLGEEYGSVRVIRPFKRSYLRKAMLVVGMFGVTTYECLYYRTPMLVFARKDDEGDAVQRLQPLANNALCTLGRLEEYDHERFCALVRLAYRVATQKSSEYPRQIDARGTERVAHAIMAL